MPNPSPFRGLSRRTLLQGTAFAALAPAGAKAASPAAETRFRLRAEAVSLRLGTAHQPESPMARLVAVDSPAPGMTVLRAREGEPFVLEIENRLDQPTAFHLRGLRGLNGEDGMPGLTGTPIPAGGTGLIRVPARQSGTFILAPSLASHVAEQNARGLHGALVVEERTRQSFDLDEVLAVADWRLDGEGRLAGDFNSRRDAARVGRLGNRLTANGAPAPGGMVVRPNARLRIRMINTSNARMIPLKVSGFSAEVVAIDSTPCQPFDPLKRTVMLAPSSRIELVLQAPPAAGQTGAIEAKIGEGIPIFTYRTEGAPLPPPSRTASLPDPGLPPAIRLQDAVRAELAITGGAGTQPADAEPAALARLFVDPAQIFRLNDGKVGGFSGKPLASLKRGRVLVLALANRTAWPQVIAVHGHAFRLLHAYDDGWEPYFLDTLYLAPGTIARVALIADNPGRWAIRSTIAEHFAAGVATWFEVT
ncbi:multicopper oxidase family protein [Rhabdaerophilum sp. SD176]|uniref:multicopper oxidase family protein n=1 Tax=Rhabdaerophilum sp. SD176 TaxID=2983548 RepID=UPI0024E00E86|nr:multicopper oxidase family protein [Rhabdaerophilum sp. SD176]